jgi:Holliday junction resolvase RusA-like endonuclease
MEIKTYHPVPSNMTRIEKILAELRLIYPISKPDFDNLAKTYADMVQKYLLLDDSLVIQAIQKKRYSCKPRIEIKFKFMTKYDCKYNKRKIESWTSYQASPIPIKEKESII